MRPDDLVPVKEAAVLVGRSVSCLRKWVRSGELPGYHQDEGHPENSPLLVSRRALLALAAGGKAPAPGRPPGPRAGPAAPVESPGLAVLRAELVGARDLVDTLRGQVAALTGQVEAERRRGEDLAREARQRVEDWRERATRAEAELAELKTREGLPLWRRLLTGPRGR